MSLKKAEIFEVDFEAKDGASLLCCGEEDEAMRWEWDVLLK